MTHESNDSSSCTQSDSTNSSNGGNPFMLCPRAGSSPRLELNRDGNSLDTVDDDRHFKLSYKMPPNHQHRAAMENLQGTGSSPYIRTSAVQWITGSENLMSSMSHPPNIVYPSSAHEECRNSIGQPASAAGFHHGSLHYPGPNQSSYPPDQWAELRQQGYVLKHVATRRDNPPSAMLLPVRCKVEDVKAGSFLLGLADGRCRRTDGKKWRCGRTVVPNQKYCERHMHRGRGRSKAVARPTKHNIPANNQPLHGNHRPLNNKPLIQLLNQFAIPVQSSSQLPTNTGQPHDHCPTPAHPLNCWLPKVPLASSEPSNETPMLAQPLHEPLNRDKLFDQAITPSGSLDRPHDQPLPPVQFELLDSRHVLKLAQADSNRNTFATTKTSYSTKIKDFRDQLSATNEIVPDTTRVKTVINANGSVNGDMSRRHIDDLDNILTLDVEGIKRLLENAPCNNKRPRLSAEQSIASRNPVDLPYVRHPQCLSTLPKQPPNLGDVLKMGEPQMLTSTRLNYEQLASGKQCAVKGHTQAPSHLAWLDQEQGGNIGSSMATPRASTADMCGALAGEEATLLPLFKVKCEEEQEMAQLIVEDGDGSTRVEGYCSQLPKTSASISKTLEHSNFPKGLQGMSAINKNRPALMAEMDHRIPGLIDESSSPHGNAMNLDMNVCSSVDERWECPCPPSPSKLKENSPALVAESVKFDVNICTLVEEMWENSAGPNRFKGNASNVVAESLSHHERSAKTQRDNYDMLEGPTKSEENCPNKLVEESSGQQESSAKIEIDLLIDIEKSLEESVEVSAKDNSANSVKGSSSELEGNMRGGRPMFLPEALRMVRSFSDSDRNVGSSSESSLNQGAVAV